MKIIYMGVTLQALCDSGEQGVLLVNKIVEECGGMKQVDEKEIFYASITIE